MKLRISTDRYLRALLRDREGYRDEMYPDGKDDKGRQLYSAGIGHQLSPEEVKRWKGKKIPNEIIETWFEEDYNNALDDANVLMIKEKIPFSENVFAAMTSASYQLGRPSFSKFKKTFGYLREGDIANAMEEAKNSEWFRGNKEKETKGTPKRVHDFNSLLDPTYNHPEKFELKDTIPFTMNFDTDMYLQRDMIGQDSSVDRLGFVNPNITSEGANARLRGRANLGFSGPMGFVDIGIDDKKNIRGEGGLYTPYGTLTGDTQENYSFQGNPFRVGDANVRLSADNMQGPKLNIDKGALSIEATEDFLRANYKNLSAKLTDEEITAIYNLNPNVLLSGRYSKDGDFNVGIKGRFRFQEGGEVQDDVGIPPMPKDPTQDVTIGTSPNAFVQPDPALTARPTPFVDTVDTTQGFYAYNPAPGESIEDFTTRTSSQFQYQPRETTQTGSFRPPEGYVSPRGLPATGGSGKLPDYRDMSGLTSIINLPTDSGLSESEIAALTTLGTLSDVLAGEDAKKVTEVNPIMRVKTFDPNNPRDTDNIFDVSDAKKITTIGDRDRIPQEFSTGGRRFNLKPGLTVIEGDVYKISDIVGKYNTKAFKALKGVVMRDPNTGQPWASDNEFNEWLKTQTAEVNIEDITPDSNIRNTIRKLGDTHLFTMQDGTYSVELKDLYDEFTAAILVGAVTGDAGKAAIAGGTQFIKSEVIESYAIKAAEAAGGVGTVAGDAIAKKWRGFGGAATSIAGVLALGGDEEAALTAGVQHLVTEYGAKAVGEFIGGGEALGGATIAAVVSFLRTGDLKQAAMSGATSYLFSVNPILGIAAMALQFLTGKKPSYKSGYASFDFDEFKMNTYSQGDYDPSKANPSNVEFSQKLLKPMMPYIQELEKTTGFDFKGDLQIHYSQGKKGAGVYYTIGNRDQEGLSAREMFLNRLDYYDGRDQSTQDGGKVYRRFFKPTQEGLEAMYESLYADLAYIAENKITDLTHYTGIVNIRQGGKISLDKGGNVQYNKGNYGLVNKKGKAPPSARADDVPMTLKEGDFVLSQPAVALYGKDTIDRMLSRAATDAGKNLKSGGKVPVNVHNGEYIIPKKLTEYIGSNVLETMNNRGLMSVGERPNT